MTRPGLFLLLLGAGLLASGCASTQQTADASRPEVAAAPARRSDVGSLPVAIRKRILALDPEHVTEADIHEVLSQAPAPQILSIHGGLLPIKWGMVSFAEFLMGLGYPEVSIRNPGNGELTYGYYHRSDMIAGNVAWYYERTGLRPIIIGQSMGGIQAIRVLHKLAGNTATSLLVWNPETGEAEPRFEIKDPRTGVTRPVVGLQVAFVAASVAGGMARIVPNEWDMNGILRDIPDSVEEFTGFQKSMDLLGGDYLGFGSANEYHPTGWARVRNVRLPATSTHGEIIYVRRLLDEPELKDWITNYQPSRTDTDALQPENGFDSMEGRVIWASEVWYSIKKYWVIELQQLIRARYSEDYGN